MTALLWTLLALFVLRVAGQALVMLARFAILMNRPIPIFFHWVLAAFVIAVGHSHRRRLKA